MTCLKIPGRSRIGMDEMNARCCLQYIEHEIPYQGNIRHLPGREMRVILEEEKSKACIV
jgi:hypothetical protein